MSSSRRRISVHLARRTEELMSSLQAVQPAPMGIDDRSADRQSHPRSVGFRGVEGLENALDLFRTNAGPRIAYFHEDAICLVLRGADRQLSSPRFDRAHCFDRVQDQVEYDLLHLHTIPLN